MIRDKEDRTYSDEGLAYRLTSFRLPKAQFWPRGIFVGKL
jgi:hypothetical protein